MNVIVWNIEKLGAIYTSPGSAQIRAARQNLIVQMILLLDADVVIIQELRRGGVSDLNAIAQTLGGGWSFDWIPGSLRTDPGNNAPTFANLGFTVTGNSEGYGVLWRNNALVRIPGAASKGQNRLVAQATDPNNNYINLVFTGTTPIFNGETAPYDADKPDIYYNTTPAPIQGGLPLGFPGSGQGTSDKSVTSKNLRTRVTDTGIQNIQQWMLARRPCYVIVSIGGTQVPIVVYHAPVMAPSNNYGTLLALCADQLTAGGPRAFAGDFNINDESKQLKLRTFSDSVGYSSQVIETDGSSPYSIIDFVNSGFTAFYEGTAILQAMRDFALAKPDGSRLAFTLSVPNAAQLVNATPQLSNTVVAQIGAPNGAAWGQINSYYLFASKFKGMSNYNRVNVLQWQSTGQFPSGSGADKNTGLAAVYNLFISDHLPVWIGINSIP